ncbi:T-cell activation inhibitor, mitochondrial-like isoform X2 [Macrobrachium nipponense]|uniref:T-cell activation inhibitor, mitochondrial-like isoform X2 n=1 Tax=Macrobrachium nipponense TaxID=159736 RepID=UPI0030C7AF30
MNNLLCCRANRFIFRWIFKSGKGWNACISRYLSSSEVATALRPFYFLVHPDLFGLYPKAQLVNEASLKLLNNHLDSLVNEKRTSPLNLQFYVKNKQIQGRLNAVALQLNNSSTRATVHGILSEFDLPTNYIDNLPEKRKEPDRKIDWHPSFYEATGTLNPEDELYTKTRKENLYSWLIKNMGEAERRLAASEPIREDIVKLRERLVTELQLARLTWVRDLSTTHLRGCLQGLTNLTVHHPEIKDVLQGRGLHFGNETGVSLEGSVVLSTSEVRNQWLQGIFRVPEQDVLIKRIPDMQKAVSNTLRNIQVTHRKYQPFFLAENYSQQLQRLVTALGDYHGTHGFPKSWPESLSSLQLVVESAAGPLMLSPTGQILTPSSCPPWLLVNFITENIEHAKQRILSYESIRDREKALHAKCKEDIGLDFLEKNDAITPDMMIDCLERLLTSSHRLNVLLSGARLWVTTYYTVMIDGEVCIPWNWD